MPPDTAAVLRGSAVTGMRHGDNAPFDADGPGTSDLDLTLVGAEAVALYKLEGFFIPKVHSRPISEKDPDIAPDLLPLRDRLMKMVGRPVNIQGTRDWVMYFREHVMGQPYLTLVRQGRDRVAVRLLTYNIRYGGVGRVGAIASVVNQCAPDVVVLQEATRPEVVEQLAAATGMPFWAAKPKRIPWDS